VAYQKLTQVLGYPASWLDQNPARVEAELAAAPGRLQPVEVQKARIRMLLEYTRAGDLARIAAPTLVLGAEDDIMVPPAHARDLVRRIPVAELELLEGAHFFPVVAAQAYAASLRRFLEAAP
jgi:pimeloyl-ACP methyl ester carboxylesterase